MFPNPPCSLRQESPRKSTLAEEIAIPGGTWISQGKVPFFLAQHYCCYADMTIFKPFYSCFCLPLSMVMPCSCLRVLLVPLIARTSCQLSRKPIINLLALQDFLLSRGFCTPVKVHSPGEDVSYFFLPCFAPKVSFCMSATCHSHMELFGTFWNSLGFKV